MPENEVKKCPLCSTVLNEHPIDSAILFVCPSCGFKIRTTRVLFPSCFIDHAGGRKGCV